MDGSETVRKTANGSAETESNGACVKGLEKRAGRKSSGHFCDVQMTETGKGKKMS
jgi:hypothetical protein